MAPGMFCGYKFCDSNRLAGIVLHKRPSQSGSVSFLFDTEPRNLIARAKKRYRCHQLDNSSHHYLLTRESAG